MTTQDKPYYKEFLELLGKVRAQISALQTDNQRLRDETRLANIQINQLEKQLSDASEQIENLKDQLAEASPVIGPADQEELSNDKAATKHRGPYTPSLFDTMDDNERMILRQQISELITIIDKHTGRIG